MWIFTVCLLVSRVVWAGLTNTQINSNPVIYVQQSQLTTKSVSLTALRRTNWCNQYQVIRNAGGDVTYALLGKNVTAAFSRDTDPFYFNVSTSTGFPMGGYMYDVMKEVAKRGRFNWQLVLVDGYANVALKELVWLTKVLPRVDVVINKPYTDSIDKRISGVGYTQPLLDASLVLITVQSLGKSPLVFFSFLRPFDNMLWAFILFVILFQVSRLSINSINTSYSDTLSLTYVTNPVVPLIMCCAVGIHSVRHPLSGYRSIHPLTPSI